MACPACSRRLLGSLIESARGSPVALHSQPRRLPNNSLMQTRSRALSTRPALRFIQSLRFPDLKHIDDAENTSQDVATPSNINPEPKVEPTSAEAVVEERTIDPDPVELRKEIGLEQEGNDVHARLWKITGGVSGTPPPPEAKAATKPAGKDNEALARTIMKYVKRSGSVVDGAPRAAEIAQAKANSKRKKEKWMVQKEALKEKFGEEGWQPRKKLSPDAMEGIRRLHASDPGTYSTPVLANEFKVSPEAIRRILKSKWRPKEDEEEERRERWEKRGEQIWRMQVEKGIKPPKKWRVKGVGSVKGGKDVVPKWKQRRSGRDQGREERVLFKEFTRPRGGNTNYGDEGGWNDRIL